MKFLVCLTAVLATAAAVDFPKLIVKFSSTGTPGEDSFYEVPRTISEAQEKEWVRPEEDLVNTLLITYCLPNDPRACALFDKKGSIAGWQLSVPEAVNSIGIPKFDYIQKGFKKRTLFSQSMLSNQMFFVPQEDILNGGRDNWNNQTGTGLWLQTGKTLTRVPNDEADMKNTDFVKQNCFPRMGQHYFYKANKELSVEDFMPWFTLHRDQQLIGFGMIAFGQQAKYYKGANTVNWFEDVPAAAIKAIAPSSPQWVYDYIDVYHIISQHIYFINEPWKIQCNAGAAKTQY